MYKKGTLKSMYKGIAGILQVVMVTVIVLCLIHLLQAVGIHVGRLYRHPQVQSTRSYQPDPAQRSFRFLLDGTVHQLRGTGDRDPNGHQIVEVYDANDNLIARGSDQERRDWHYLSFPRRMDQSSNRIIRYNYAITPVFSASMDVPVFKGKTLAEIWRYDRRRQIFTGYSRTGQSLGFLGQEGLKKNAVDALGLGKLKNFEAWWAPAQDRPKLLWWTQSHLYEIDVKTRQVDHLVDCNDGAIDLVWSQAWITRHKTDRAYVDPNLYRPLIVCQTGRTYHLILREPDQRITVTLPETWSHFFTTHDWFVATKTDLLMERMWTDFRRLPSDASMAQQWQYFRDYRSTKKRHWTALYRVDDQGHLTQLHALSWMETQVRAVPERPVIRWTSERWIRSLSPGLYNWMFSWVTRHYHPGRDSSLMALMRLGSEGAWDYWFPTLVLLCLAFWHGQKRWGHKVRNVPWLLWILAFNLAGFLSYLALNHTPLIHCASCGKKRGLQQDACPRCHAPLAEPQHTKPHLVMA